jgi:hypothetical protein
MSADLTAKGFGCGFLVSFVMWALIVGAIWLTCDGGGP